MAGRKPQEQISMREFARRLHISPEAVSKAVEEKKIKKGWDPKTQKIRFDTAMKEWGFMHVHKVTGPAPNTPDPNGSLKLTNSSSYADAKRVKEIIQANIAGLQLSQLKGELVKKDEVYKQLYEYGQQLRTALSSIPDRMIDEIIAAKDRPTAHLILSNAILEVLTGLTTVEFDFSERQ